MKFFTSNIGAKILALLCAIFLWVYVSIGETKVAYFPGNLEIAAKNTPEGLAAVYDQQRVKVKLQAPYETWNKLSVDNFSAYVDLSGMSEGTYDVEVNVSVNLNGVSIVEKEPGKVIVRLEPIEIKEVPVKVKFEGEAKSGFVPGEVVAKPDKVEIKGAKSLVEKITEATALIKLSGEEDGFQKSVSLASYDANSQKELGIEFDPKTVNVTVPIVPASESKSVGVKVKTRGKPNANFYVAKIEVNPATIEVSGAGSSLKSILNLETREVNIEGIDKDYEKDIELVVPSGLSVTDKTVRVKISLGPNTISKEVTASFSYPSLSSGLTVTSISPSSVKIVASCPLDVLNTLSPDKAIVSFNLQGKGAGSYYLSIAKEMVTLPAGCFVASWLPSAVTIVLQ